MERDDGIKLQQLPCSDNFTSLAAASSSRPPPQIRPSAAASHTCGYCKREFRSAQGLGGHMNVHRMDRARLIHHQCSPHHRLAPLPNSNPSHRRTVLDLLGSGCCCCPAAHAAAGDGGSAVPAAAMANCRLSSASSSATTKDDFEVKNLERRMGACSHGDDGAEARLDLELRLGYS